MFDMPHLMRAAQDLARNAGARQAVIAENIAQANTPGFRARDMPLFDPRAAGGLRATRPTHLDSGPHAAQPGAQPDRSAPALSPNGNSVSLEREMMRAAQTRQAHEMALASYSSARAILRTALGR